MDQQFFRSRSDNKPSIKPDPAGVNGSHDQTDDIKLQDIPEIKKPKPEPEEIEIARDVQIPIHHEDVCHVVSDLVERCGRVLDLVVDLEQRDRGEDLLARDLLCLEAACVGEHW